MLGRFAGPTYKQIVASKAKLDKIVAGGKELTARQANLYTRDIKALDKHDATIAARKTNTAAALALNASRDAASRAAAAKTAQDAQAALDAKAAADAQAAAQLAAQQAATAQTTQNVGGNSNIPSWAYGGGGGGTSTGSYSPSGAFPGDISSFAPSAAPAGSSPSLAADGSVVAPDTSTLGMSAKLLIGAAAIGAAFMFFKRRGRK